jgi:hypothetical protein
VYSEARTALRAVMADFLFNCWCLEIASNKHIGHVAECVCNRAQNFSLEAFQDFCVWSGSGSCWCRSLQECLDADISVVMRRSLSYSVAAISNLLLASVSKRCQSLRSRLFLQA